MTRTPPVELHPAICSDLARVRVLLDDHLRESSNGTRGVEDYPDFDAYWSRAGHIPYLIERASQCVGFAFVRSSNSIGTEVNELTEFYLVPSARTQKLGATVVAELSRRHPGLWKVAPRPATAARVDRDDSDEPAGAPVQLCDSREITAYIDGF